MSYVKQKFYEGQTLTHTHLNNIEDGLSSILGASVVVAKSEFVNGSYSGTNLTTTEKNRIRTALLQVKAGESCYFALEDGWTGYIAYQTETNGTFTVATTWVQTATFEFPVDCSFIAVHRKDDNSTITPADYNGVTEIRSKPTASIVTSASSNSIEVKEYFQEELETTIASVKECLTEPCLVFPMLSDIHYMVSKQKPKGVDDCINNLFALSKELEFDFIACLGDITEGDQTQEITQNYNDHMMRGFKKIDVPYYHCVGNHDDNRYKEKFTHAQLYRNFIRNTKDVVFDNQTTMCGTNFYKDFDEFNIRCIFLNANSNGSYGYSSDTCDWFDSVVESTTGRFIVFTHIDPNPAHNYGLTRYGNDAGSNRIRQTCADNADKFIILFSGHNHYDASFTDPFLSFTINCQKFENENGDPTLWAEGAVKPTRTMGDATEDCFDIVVVRPIAKKINRIRFGAGDDQEYTYE